MHRRCVVPSQVTYSALVGSCEDDRQALQSLEVVEVMLRQGIGPNAITCSGLLQCLATASQIETGLAFGDLLARRGHHVGLVGGR